MPDNRPNITTVVSRLLQSKCYELGALTFLSCCIVVFSDKGGDHCGFNFVMFAAAVVDMVLFMVLAVYSIYIVAARKLLKPMSARMSQTLNRINFTLFVYWIASRLFPVITGPWIVPIIGLIWLGSMGFALANPTEKVSRGEER